MKPGRNDPCPCGSGRKYKHCCAHLDIAASPALSLAGHSTQSSMRNLAKGAISLSLPWIADVAPVPMSLGAEPAARPAVILLAALETILHCDLISRPPSDAQGIAALLLAAIESLIRDGSAPPSTVYVRHASVATQLAPMLLRHGVREVLAVPVLPVLDEFAVGLRQQMSGARDRIPAISNPEMWAAWELPSQTVHDLFVAAAAYYTAAPWRVLQNADLLEYQLPNGTRWYGVILGDGGEEFGIGLYEKREDFMALVTAPDPATGFGANRGIVISLTFDARSSLPKPMRREIADAKWPVAGPMAYPNVWTMNTIGGGFSETFARDLMMVLDVTTRFGADLGASNDRKLALEAPWMDDHTGAMVQFALPFGDLSLWEMPEFLATSLPQGARANPYARTGVEATQQRLETEDAQLVARFVKHAQTQGIPAKRITSDWQSINLFVEIIHGHQGLYLPAVTEYDLRCVLYDLLPRKTMTSKSHADSMRSSLKRFFEYLAAHEELRYPWALPILRDKFAFIERWESFSGGHWWNAEVQEWMTELTDDLNDRVLLPGVELAGVGAWGDTMGIDEAALYGDLHREWLVWRDEEIANGFQLAFELRDRLVARQAQWEQQPHPQFKGVSPSKVIARERKRMAK